MRVLRRCTVSAVTLVTVLFTSSITTTPVSAQTPVIELLMTSLNEGAFFQNDVFTYSLSEIPSFPTNGTFFLDKTFAGEADIQLASTDGRLDDGRLIEFPNTADALIKRSVGIWYPNEGFAGFKGKSVRICLRMWGNPEPFCSPSLPLIDDDVTPGIILSSTLPLLDEPSTWNAGEGTTDNPVRIAEDMTVFLRLKTSTKIYGKVIFSIQIDNSNATTTPEELVNIDILNNTLFRGKDYTTLAIRGVRDSTTQEENDASRTGVLLVQAVSAKPSLDEAYNKFVTLRIPFILFESPLITKPTSIPTMTLSETSISVEEKSYKIVYVTLTPAPPAGKTVRVLVAGYSFGKIVIIFPFQDHLDFQTPANPTADEMASMKIGVNLQFRDENVAFGDHIAESLFSVDTSDWITTAPPFTAIQPIIVRCSITDNDSPMLDVSKTWFNLTEGVNEGTVDNPNTFTVAISSLFASSYTGGPITVSVDSADYSCGGSATSLPDFNTSCISNEDCPALTPVCLRVDDVTLQNGPRKASFQPSTLIFTVDNYNVPQTVTVTAPADGYVEGNHSTFAVVRFSDDQGVYNSLSPVTVQVEIVDTDISGVTFETIPLSSSSMEMPSQTIVLRENASTPLNFRLNSIPLAPVSVTFTFASPSASTVNSDNLLAVGSLPIISTVSFANLKGKQNLTMSWKVVDDAVQRGSGKDNSYFLFASTLLRSLDPMYNMSLGTALIKVIDNDRAGMLVGFTSSSVTELQEGSLTNKVGVSFSLFSRPTDDVTVQLVEVLDTSSVFSKMSDVCAIFPSDGSQLVVIPGTTNVIGNVTFTPTDFTNTKFLQIFARADSRIEGKSAKTRIHVDVQTNDKALSDYATAQITTSANDLTVSISEDFMVDPPASPEVYFSDDLSTLIVSISLPNAVLAVGASAGTTSSTSTAALTPVTPKAFHITDIFTLSPSGSTLNTSRVCSSPSAAEVASSTTAFGTGATWYRTITGMSIILGSDTTVSPLTDSLVLVPGVLRASSGAFRSSIGTAIIIKDARKIVAPKIVLAKGIASLKVGSCDLVMIPASVSGTAGRPYSISWGGVVSTYTAGAPPADLQATISASSAGTGRAFLTLSTTALPSGTSVTIKATLTNFRGTNATSDITITRASYPTPDLSLPSTMTIVRSASLSVSARALLSTCDNATSSANSLSFFWYDVTSGTNSSALASNLFRTTVPANQSFIVPGLPLNIQGRVLTLPSASLPVGKSTFKVFAVPKSTPAFYSTATIEITVEADVLVATLEGGLLRDVPFQQNFTLNGTGSGEPTALLRATQTGINFTWTCVTAFDNSPCPNSTNDVLKNATTLSVDIDSSLVTANSKFLFTLTVSSEGRMDVSASQTVFVLDDIEIPKFLYISVGAAMEGAARIIPFTPRLYMWVTCTLNQAFNYTWFLGEGVMRNDAVLSATTTETIVLTPSDLTPDTAYTLCMTGNTYFPIRARGTVCQNFATGPTPVVGAVTVNAVDGSSSSLKSYAISVAFTKAVVSLRYAAISSAYVTNILRLYPSSVTSAAAITQYAVQQGYPGAYASLLDSRTASETAIVSSLVPSGDIAVCVFGTSATGEMAVSCVLKTIPAAPTLTSSGASSLLDSQSASGEASNTLAGTNYVHNNVFGSKSRRLATSATGSIVKALLKALDAAYSQTLSGTGSDLSSVGTSLANIASSISKSGDADDAVACRALALKVMTSMNTLNQLIADASLQSFAESLMSCGQGSVDTISALVQQMTGSASSSTFSATASDGLVSLLGSSGLTRSPISFDNGVVIASANVPAALSSGMPNIVVGRGAGITFLSTATDKNLTEPLEVQFAGILSRNPSDRSPLFSITFPKSTLASIGANKVPQASYFDPFNPTKVLHDGVVLESNADSYTLYATHNSTFAITEGIGTKILVASSADAADSAVVSTLSVSEATSSGSAVYVKLQSAPDYDVVVDIVVPPGICYFDTANADGGENMVLTADMSKAFVCSSSSDCGSGSSCKPQFASVSPTSIKFTPSNWAIPKLVIIIATADSVAEMEAPVVEAMLSFIPTSKDSRYDSVGICTDDSCSSKVANSGASVHVTIVDADTAGIRVISTPSSISEGASAGASYTVALSSKPSYNVTVTPEYSGFDLKVTTSSLTFTPSTWNIPQHVTVIPVDDFLLNGNRSRTISHTASSTDIGYASHLLASDSAILTIADDDVAGIVFSTFSPSLIREEGDDSATTFTVALTSKPSAPVVLRITAASSTTTFSFAFSGTGITSNSTLTIQPDKWNKAVKVTLASTSDGLLTGAYAVAVSISGDSTASQDTAFASAITTVSRSITVLDIDGPGFFPSIALTGAVAEGSSFVYTLSLQSAPTTKVTVVLGVNASAENVFSGFPSPFTVDPSTITFTSQNFDTPQTISVASAEDQIAYPASLMFDLTHTVVIEQNMDTAYAGLKPLLIPLSWKDNDVPAIQMTPSVIDMASNNNGSSIIISNVSVTIATKPVTTVIVHLSTNDASNLLVTLSSHHLTFNSSNWQAAQTTTVTLGTQLSATVGSVTITAMSGGSGSGDYAGFDSMEAKTVITIPIVVPSATPSASASPSVSPSISVSPSVSPSPSPSPSVSPTPSLSPSASPTPSPSPSVSTSPSPSPSVSPTPSPSPSASPTPSSSPSASPTPSRSHSASTSPSPSCSASTSHAADANIVRLTLTFNSVDPSILATSSAARDSIVQALASSAGVEASTVAIRRVLQKEASGVLTSLWVNSEYAANIAAEDAGKRSRRLSLSTTAIVDAVIVASNSSQASVLTTSINANLGTFADSVGTTLKAADPTTFGSVTTSLSLGFPNVVTADSSEGLTAGAKAGIVVGVVVLAASVLAAIYFHSRKPGNPQQGEGEIDAANKGQQQAIGSTATTTTTKTVITVISSGGDAPKNATFAGANPMMARSLPK